jgi:hypothetical protein
MTFVRKVASTLVNILSRLSLTHISCYQRGKHPCHHQSYTLLRTELCCPVWCIAAQGAINEFGIHLFLTSSLSTPARGHLAQQKPFLGA